jgi:hypothetical protein
VAVIIKEREGECKRAYYDKPKISKKNVRRHTRIIKMAIWEYMDKNNTLDKE